MLKSLATATVVLGTIVSSMLLSEESKAIGLTPLVTTDFTTFSNIIDSAASIGSALNTGVLETGTIRTTAAQATNGGFGNFFTALNTPSVGPSALTFLAVGGVGASSIGSSFKQNNSAANSAIFTLTAADISLDLELKFDYIFAGYISNTVASRSGFLIELLDVVLGVPLPFITVILPNDPAVSPGSGRFTNDSASNVSTVISSADLLANYGATGGDFFVRVTVNEPGTAATNTVGGFQNFTVESIPFDFEPTAGIAILGVGFGLNKLRKTIKAKKDNVI
jgi:hypothetical protein